MQMNEMQNKRQGSISDFTKDSLSWALDVTQYDDRENFVRKLLL